MIWIGFLVFVILMLVLDLGVFNRKAHVVRIREALLMSAFWIGLALVFNLLVWHWRGGEKALEFLAAYLLEKSLSIDNLFVFLVLFSYFKLPAQYQHRVLFWGIIGALVMRAAFIFAGVALIQNLHWVIYLFGGFLVVIGIKMAAKPDEEVHPEKNPVLKLVRRLLPVTPAYEGGKFFTWRDGKRWATPLLVVLVAIETTDVVFAIDSIPAVLAITQDTFIAYSSNVFAILGLRALFFALAGVMTMFHFLRHGLAVILVFVGIKMLIADYYPIPIQVALGVVAAIIVLSITVSVIHAKLGPAAAPPPGPG